MFDESAGGGDPGGPANRAEVVERTGTNQESTWQAEILVPQGGMNHSGRTRTFMIRGPPRKEKEVAEEDAKQLTDCAAQGARAVRTLANQMHHRK